MKELKNHNAEYTVFRAYDKYWLVNSSLVSKCSVNLSDIRIICSVDKISINEVLKMAKSKAHKKQIKYEPFMAVKIGE